MSCGADIAMRGPPGESRDAKNWLNSDPELVMGERLEAIRRDQVVPFVAHSRFIFDVQAGLQRDDVAGLENLIALRDEVRGLRVAEAQAMSRMAGKRVP